MRHYSSCSLLHSRQCFGGKLRRPKVLSSQGQISSMVHCPVIVNKSPIPNPRPSHLGRVRLCAHLRSAVGIDRNAVANEEGVAREYKGIIDRACVHVRHTALRHIGQGAALLQRPVRHTAASVDFQSFKEGASVRSTAMSNAFPDFGSVHCEEHNSSMVLRILSSDKEISSAPRKSLAEASHARKLSRQSPVDPAVPVRCRRDSALGLHQEVAGGSKAGKSSLW